MATTKRYIVRDAGEGITRKIVNRWRVIDTRTNTIVDEYSTKRPAAMDAAYRNRYEAEK